MPKWQVRDVLRNKEIFRKRNGVASDGSTFVDEKERLVTRVFQQLQEISYEDLLAPVVKFIFLRLFRAILATEKLELHKMDVETAFLNGDLSEDVLMDQQEGLNFNYTGHVWKLL